MTAPNVNTLWGRAIVDELAKAGIERVCIAPGSRSTPLAVAAFEHEGVDPDSLLDERSAAFYVLGRAKAAGTPTPLVCTSGTAAAEFHPAVIEADQSRTPMLVLTADRPPELQDSGANQTVDQEQLYGNAVRWYRTLPEPAVRDRTLRSLRTTVARAVSRSTGRNPGPVHLNVPFAKPLAPSEPDGSVPDDFGERFPLAARGRDGPYVRLHGTRAAPDSATVAALVDAVRAADRGLIVAGPAGAGGLSRAAATALADGTGFPILADPLSGVRFGPHVDEAPVIGGYDAYLDTRATADWPSPDLVLRFGASPTSKALRQHLASSGARQVLVDPAGGWREATFTAGDLVPADPDPLVEALLARLDSGEDEAVSDPWGGRFDTAEAEHWDLVTSSGALFDGGIAARVVEHAPGSATVFVSNSMPVRELDRFGKPSTADLTVVGNRGASGIDGITSTAIGAASAGNGPLVLLIGDLACYHDLTGMLALDRVDVEVTIVVLNNDGGGIFHALPIADVDPPFTELFKTPHGIDFGKVADLFGVAHEPVDSMDAFTRSFRDVLTRDGSHLIEVKTDAEASFAVRDRLEADLVGRLE